MFLELERHEMDDFEEEKKFGCKGKYFQYLRKKNIMKKI